MQRKPPDACRYACSPKAGETADHSSHTLPNGRASLGNAAADTHVILQEVCPRDGLQNEPVTLPVEVRAQIIEGLSEAGLRRIQVGSFVNPARVPQMAGTDQVWRLVRPREDTRYSALVLNHRGLGQALAAGIPHLEIYVSASETHSSRNVGMTVQEALSQACSMIDSALAAGLSVTAGVMCAFGCFYEGDVPVARVVDLVAALDRSDAVEIGLADTTGMADGTAVREMLQALSGQVKPPRIAMHFHDTRGQGLANVRASLDLGVRRFDTAVGGLGGCPFIPGAAGNISTERTIHLLEEQGFETGIDLSRLAAVREMLARNLGKRLPAS